MKHCFHSQQPTAPELMTLAVALQVLRLAKTHLLPTGQDQSEYIGLA